MRLILWDVEYMESFLMGKSTWVLIMQVILKPKQPMRMECYQLATTKCMWSWVKLPIESGKETLKEYSEGGICCMHMYGDQLRYHILVALIIMLLLLMMQL
jgi:hypothetical protein